MQFIEILDNVQIATQKVRPEYCYVNIHSTNLFDQAKLKIFLPENFLSKHLRDIIETNMIYLNMKTTCNI